MTPGRTYSATTTLGPSAPARAAGRAPARRWRGGLSGRPFGLRLAGFLPIDTGRRDTRPYADDAMRRRNSRFTSLLSRGRREEEGFSLVELMVALGVLLIALLALARTATVAFTDVAAARQRQTGAQLANRLLEEIRGLPYTTVKSGLSDSDLTADSRVISCSGVLYYRACPPTAGAEKIVHSPMLPATKPLVPHTGSVGPPAFPSTYSWRVYVTEAAGAPSKGAYRVTVRVSWEANVRRGLRNFVEAQTLIYSPKGCVDPATHPFSAPCQPYYYGNGSAGGGTLQTTGTVSGVAFDSIGGSSAGTSASTTQATAANSCNLQTDNRPCGFGPGTAAGPVTESLVLSGGTGTANLVSVGTSASPVTTYVRRFVPAGGEPGLIRETVTWNLPQISMGGLPSGLASTPSGGQGYWVRLTGFNASTAVEAGLGTIAPTASIPEGQISSRYR